MIFVVRNKTIIVTGGNLGIVLLILKNLILKRSKFKKNKSNLDIEIDLSDTKKIQKLLNNIKQNFNKIDGLINCHEITMEIDVNTDLSENFDETINNNLKSTYVLSSLVCEQMSKKSGSVVNITSF